MFFQLVPGVSERALPWLIPRLWRAWSPGYDPAGDLPDVFAALDGPGRRTAALRYYRAFLLPWVRSDEYAAEQSRWASSPRVPVLYMHGARDGAQLPAVARRAERILRPPSRFELVEGAGHFLHLERPDHVNGLIAEFVGSAA
jgi:pimeloyl-ACP methyl ester carboxylesterase